MYFAGTFDFSTEAAAVNKAMSLKFPARVPLDIIVSQKKRSREEEGSVSYPSITSVATGHKHLVCVIKGSLYGMGVNMSHQLGGGAMPSQLNTLRELALTATSMGLSAPIIKVACGRKHTMALTANGEVYTTGDNTFNQLGHSNRRGDWAAVRVGTNNVVQIAAGGDSCFALTGEGHVFSWGRGESLALGHPITRIEALHPTTLLPIFLNIDTPTRIEGFVTRRVKIIEISVGTEHAVARDDKDVFTFGQNSFGKLGTGDVQDQLTPFRVPFPEKKTVERLMQVMAAGRTTLVLKHNPDFGTITYIFGKEGGSQDGTLVPRIIGDAPLSIARLCGGGYGASIYSAITAEGHLITWGHSSTMASMLRTNEAPAMSPSPVTHINDKVVVRDAAFAGGHLSVVVADVEETVARMPKDTLKRDIVVPYDKRIALTHLVQKQVDIHDEVLATFYRQLLGEVDGASYVAAMEKPPPYDPNALKPKIVKQGTKALHQGSRVRVWMTDVYALGTVTNANPLDIKSPHLGEASANPQRSPKNQALGSFNSTQLEEQTLETADSSHKIRNNHFEVTWLRDDWDPEIIELYSDDETLDEENANRWQKLWFLGAPEDNCI
eukprot:GILI01018500.1.p1 GENE.GILI01018500.1~~GILI01018500.1.p1  ORF type:complete len:608 (+),score=99.26 GILI01018500.1:77-1900(+)